MRHEEIKVEEEVGTVYGDVGKADSRVKEEAPTEGQFDRGLAGIGYLLQDERIV